MKLLHHHHKPVLEDNDDNGDNRQVNDVVDSLNYLYRSFQDDFVENPAAGQVFAASRSHIVCNGARAKKVLTLSDLYLYDTPQIREIRKFVTLLPPSATFRIIHQPDSYDVFCITWKDGELVIPPR